MKFATTLAALAASAVAQRIQIGAPKNLAQVKPGSKITVEVDRPNSLTGSTEVAIAIGLWPCGGPKGTSKCASTDVSQVLGNVVYTGSFKPEYDSKAPTKPPHQNFEITVPSTFSSGQVSLGIAHLSLVGAGASPFYEFTNITLVIP
ncbi:hypothetical protein LXA43DRAFT_86615 [Ganoderma leucocontextum]|nr:hypothetical protein LXA43DRAFT_86615 [Ganoderma leucocontextum]